MADKRGYFIHNVPDEIPSNYQFAFVRSRIGLSSDPTLDRNWNITRYLDRGLYQFPKLTAENNVYEHSTRMVEDTWNQTDAKWIVLCALYVDLQFINTWVGQIVKQAPNYRPVIYTTYEQWDSILKGDNAEQVALTILNKADLCISKYRVDKPILPKYCRKLKFWEYEQNKIYWNEEGLEVAQSLRHPQDPRYEKTCHGCLGTGEVEEVKTDRPIITIYKAHGIYATEL